LNLIDVISRPGALLIRLYFNILVGEILSGIAMSVTPYVLPSLVIVLELFVAVVQAYIFAILSSVYISLLSDDHH
jgi:F-type H+-transporting ATPase subunit a